jgi:hypothetical protein
VRQARLRHCEVHRLTQMCPSNPVLILQERHEGSSWICIYVLRLAALTEHGLQLALFLHKPERKGQS